MTSPTDSGAVPHPVVSRDAWLAQRKRLLAREKELTRLSDRIARERRELPWLRIDNDYVFATPDGPRSLAELFDGRHQLLVQHLMFAPGWGEACRSCSYMADHVDGMLVHMAHRDTSFVAVSRAPLAEIEAFRQRMGWRFRWASSHGNDFNRDFHVTFTPEEIAEGQYNFGPWPFPLGEEMPGISVFYKDEDGDVFHAYSCYGRGVEVMMGTYGMLDLTPLGRGKDDDSSRQWLRHHDRYDDSTKNTCCEGHG